MFEGINIFNDIITQDRQALKNALREKKISHAYLFAGNDRDMAENACREFSAAVLSDDEYTQNIILDRISKNTHADVLDVYPDGAGIKLAQLRNSIGFLQTSPTESDYKILVLHDADTMRAEAQNFLLKTIEEPPRNTVVILVAPSSKDNILTTIISRVSIVNLKNRQADTGNAEIRRFVSERMEKLILEGSIEGIFSTASAMTRTAEDKNISQKDAALMNLEYVYSFFVSMLTYAQTNTLKDYTKEDFGILYSKIGKLCNINIIDIIKNTIGAIEKNASPQLAVEAMLIDILEECNAENSWNKI